MHPAIKRLFILLVMFLLSFALKSQNKVTISATVFPPYSTDFSYYINHPNKIQVTFLNTTNQPLDIYIQGRLTGDNGVEIKSDPSWHPSLPVTLQPGIPFQLSQDNIDEIFSSNHLIYIGTSEDELIRMGGLPEGNYQFCFSVYDFNTSELLSDENIGCSNIFIIKYVDPPVILSPVCGDSILSTNPQNVIISWTPAVGASPNTRYKFIMVEMHPGDRNPSDALLSATPPYFIEKDLIFTQLLVGPEDPPLVEGRSYAFYVQAYDPDNRIIFKNNGVSEACWFTYKKSESIPNTDSSGLVNNDFFDFDGFTSDFEFIPNTQVSGRLHYKLASLVQGGSATGAQSHPSQGSSTGNNNSRGNYNDIGETGGTGGGNANNFHTGFNFNIFYQSPANVNNIILNPPLGTGTLNESVYSVNNADPLRNTTIRLVVRFGTLQNDGFFEIHSLSDGYYGGGLDINGYTFYDLNGNEISKEKVLSVVDKVLDVCTTDDQGNFSFDFNTDFFTGPVYASSSGNNFGNSDYVGVVSLKIEVENQKFCSPDVDIFANLGDDIQLAPQIALIKDYNLNLKVVSAYDVYNHIKEGDTIITNYDTKPKAIPGGEPIPNAIVQVLRNSQKLGNEHPAILLSEGSQSGKMVTNDYGEFKEVFYGLTDNDGKINIPHLVEHWAVTDGEDQSPYLFYVRTRKENVDSAYSETLYNYEPFFGTIKGLKISVDAGSPTELDDDAGFNGTQPVTYNHAYQPPASATDREVPLNAAKPEIQGRLMASSNLENIPIKDAIVTLYEQVCPTCNKAFYNRGFKFTNNAGFFRFTNLNVNVDDNGKAAGPYRRIFFNNSLYKSFLYPPENQAALNLKYGELFFKEFQLEPDQILKGKVVDELGNPVASYVRLLPNNPFVKTEPRWEYDENGNIYVSSEYFEIVAGNGVSRFEIQPLSNSYFADTITVTSFTPGYIQTFTVYRKMHRLRLQLYDKISHGVISNAKVIVGDTLAIGTTNNAGIAELVFPSPGEQFIVRVFADKYTPTQASFNIPVSKSWQNETMEINYALHIEGTVTEAVSGQPVDSALVYTELQNTDGHTLFLETYTDINGNYRLNGLPWYDSPTDIEVHAVKPGKNPSYIGQTKTITVKSSMTFNGYDFQIKAADGWDLSNIWGFPVTVENMVTRVQFGTRISGYFYNLPHHPDFNTINQNEKIYFKGLKVTKGPNGEIIPETGEVKTESYTLPIKINGGFEGKLFVPFNNQYDYKIKLKKDGKNGLVKGGLKIDLSSFKFTYDFAGDMYLGDDTTNVDVVVFKSGNSSEFNLKHYLFDYKTFLKKQFPKPINNFRVFGFNASSDFKGSYIQDGTIHISTTFHTDIPMPNGNPSLDLNINAGEIQITKENMDLVHNPDNQLSFDLEKWKVVSTDGWTFDKTRDAIIIPKGNIYTGLGVDVSIKGLNVRPDALREGKIDFNKGLSLGGITTLQLASGMKPKFNYDAGVGHYRISMVGSTNGPVGWVDNLPATSDRLEFTSIGMLSDNSTVLSLGKTMRFHNLMDVYVDQIMSGEGFFRLAGMPDLGIPNFVATRAEMTYTKENGKLKFKLEPLSGGPDCNANVSFTFEQKKESQSLTDKLYTSYGTFYVKPPPGESGDKIQIRGLLHKTPSECYIDVVTPQAINMGKEKFDIIKGRISVTNNQWSELNFTAHTHSIGLDNSNVLTFNVHGGIEVTGDDIKVDNIDTPLGSFNISYIFPEKALVGDLTIGEPVMLGFGSLNSGMLATRFDPHGFYIGFAGSVSLLNDTYDGGFLMGVYDTDLNDVAQPMLKNFETNIPSFNSLHGFYVIGQRSVIDKTFPLLIIDVLAKAGFGVFVHLDYNQGLFNVGGYGFAKMRGGVNVTGCGYVGVKQDAYAELIGKYENKNLSFSTCQSISTCVGACGLDGCIDILSRMKVSTNRPSENTLKLGGTCVK